MIHQMQPYKLLLLFTVSLAMLLSACQKEMHSPLSDDGQIPDTLRNVRVASLPGAARITYTLPGNAGILYVRADYENKPGVKREIKASYYNNSLVVDGFGDTLTHTINLYVVSRSERQSRVVTVTVQPLVPAVMSVYRSLAIREDFGGVNITFKNESKADIAIVTLTNDSLDVFGQADVHYTASPGAAYSLRGYAATKRTFSFFVKDRWGNLSDTLTGEYTPMYEKLLDKSKFREVDLPGDIGYGWGLSMSYLWNGVFSGYDMWHSADKLDGMPVWITFDLGVTVQLSRIGLWQRQQDGFLYAQNNLKQFEIWGSVDPPADGSWDNWTKLVEHTVVKPSNLPIGQVSQEDINAAAAGEQMDVPLTEPRVRYIRVKVLKTWTDGGYAANIAEMSFWGNDQ
jgi:hypothetical protein